MLQPQNPPPCVATQADIEVLAHLMQASPLKPHAVAAVPTTQVEPMQQPPLHGWPGLQAVVHWCTVVSQA
jgi:hypothetical protein